MPLTSSQAHAVIVAAEVRASEIGAAVVVAVECHPRGARRYQGVTPEMIPRSGMIAPRVYA